MTDDTLSKGELRMQRIGMLNERGLSAEMRRKIVEALEDVDVAAPFENGVAEVRVDGEQIWYAVSEDSTAE